MFKNNGLKNKMVLDIYASNTKTDVASDTEENFYKVSISFK